SRHRRPPQGQQRSRQRHASLSHLVPFFTRLAGRAQSGYIFTYAFAMVLGILVLVTWMTLAGGN
ncbi:MAG: hypothetical protein AAF222_12035, partial [Pseudomonadota bacterium]